MGRARLCVPFSLALCFVIYNVVYLYVIIFATFLASLPLCLLFFFLLASLKTFSSWRLQIFHVFLECKEGGPALRLRLLLRPVTYAANVAVAVTIRCQCRWLASLTPLSVCMCVWECERTFCMRACLPVCACLSEMLGIFQKISRLCVSLVYPAPFSFSAAPSLAT